MLDRSAGRAWSFARTAIKSKWLIFGGAVAALCVVWLASELRREQDPHGAKNAVQSFVAPTLDTSLPANGSATCSASFELAWNKRKIVRDRRTIALDLDSASKAYQIVAARIARRTSLIEQGIDFRLNKDGVVLESRAQIEGNSFERKTPAPFFVFNRTYLIYVIERYASRSLFAMWVDDAKMVTAK